MIPLPIRWSNTLQICKLVVIWSPFHIKQCNKHNPWAINQTVTQSRYSILLVQYSRGGGIISALTHFRVQSLCRQHLLPREHLSSASHPVILPEHFGVGFSTGHRPGLVPGKRKTAKQLLVLMLVAYSHWLSQNWKQNANPLCRILNNRQYYCKDLFCSSIDFYNPTL